MIKSSIKYSVLCGFFLVALFWVSIKAGSNPVLDIRHLLFDVVLFFLFIFFAAKEYKTYHNGGFLHYWQGMTIACIVYVPAAVIFSIAVWLLFYLDGTLLSEYKIQAAAFLETQKDTLLQAITEEEYQKNHDSIQKTTVGSIILDSGVKKIITGFFITPVVSIILRKKPN